MLLDDTTNFCSCWTWRPPNFGMIVSGASELWLPNTVSTDGGPGSAECPFVIGIEANVNETLAYARGEHLAAWRPAMRPNTAPAINPVLPG